MIFLWRIRLGHKNHSFLWLRRSPKLFLSVICIFIKNRSLLFYLKSLFYAIVREHKLAPTCVYNTYMQLFPY